MLIDDAIRFLTAMLPVVLPDLLDRVEKELIQAAMWRAKGVKTKAAAMLGINRTTFVMKMRKYDLPLNAPSRPGARRTRIF
jgi:DNA-binding NtrC family response regulator